LPFSDLDPEMPVSTLTFAPFGSAHCDLVAELKPEVVSFHFGLPNEDLLGRVKAVGAKILSSATSVKEAIWLEQRGCDAIIAQGLEAGGHRGMFLSDNVATRAGTMALVPQVADAVGVPVIAAGGIADERGIAAAFMLGASGVQMGTAYLFCPEANVSPLHRQALKTAQDDQTVLTNVLSGRAAGAIVNRIVRELGPMTEHASAFPLAGAALAPLRSGSEPVRIRRLHALVVRSGRTSRSRTPSGRTDRASGQTSARKTRSSTARTGSASQIAKPIGHLIASRS
jgi:nitronate monooxygenase